MENFVIPNVFIADLGWLLICVLIYDQAVIRKLRIIIPIAKLMCFYVLIETLFHKQMEDAVALFI